MYEALIRVDAKSEAVPKKLERVPLGAIASDGGVKEDFLQDVLFRFPDALPIEAIDRAYAGAVPICQELQTGAGYADALYVNAAGRLTLAEFKLWRNPEARREVIGQILDYAKELASWDYEHLERQIAKARKESGNTLYDLVCAHSPGESEAGFVDNVVRHLKKGEFLLLVVGDGIREDAERIVDFVQQQLGLRFTIALIEAALYRDSGDCLLVQPRVLFRTEIVDRWVVEVDEGRIRQPTEKDHQTRQAGNSDRKQDNLRFWTAVLSDLAFTDKTMDSPMPSEDATLFVLVENSGEGGWGLCFGGFVRPSTPQIGCYLTRRKNIQRAVRIFDEIKASLEDLGSEAGQDLSYWEEQGRPRIGFRCPIELSNGRIAQDDFGAVVSWMREHLDLLVSTIHPHLQRKLRRRG